MVRIAVHCPPEERYLRLYRQAGVTDIVTGPPSDGGGGDDLQRWLDLRKRVDDAGLRLSVIESIPVPEEVKLGLPGRDEALERFLTSLRAMGSAGIPILCYNWMAVIPVQRTSRSAPVRGGALSVAYDHAEASQSPVPEGAGVSEGQLWGALEYFLRAAVPVAEEVGVKLAMHPDDPPISPTRGVARILTSPEAFQRMIDLVPSSNNGLTYCQGCFAEMGADVPATIRQFAGQGKMFFAHFRNLTGTLTSFVETFHDEGETDMFEAMRAYVEVGFDGPMRPDHLPIMEGEGSDPGAYHFYGRLHAIGYMRGLLDAIARTA